MLEADRAKRCVARGDPMRGIVKFLDAEQRADAATTTANSNGLVI